MSTGYLPESITKEILFERAQERFQSWAKMYGDPNIFATYMYEDMSVSCYCGCPADDFPEIIGPEKPVKISDNEFKYRGVTFRVTHDNIDDKSYIWCDACEEFGTLVHWVWGSVFAADTWLIGTEMLDKFIDSHEKKD